MIERVNFERLNFYHASCDTCNTRFTVAAEYITLKRRLYEEGWWVLGNECRCPECREKGSREVKE